jgi:glutamine synthetase
MDYTEPRGRLSENELRALVRRGEIDTVLAVFPDFYGRLVGKRITGRFFLESILGHGMHACNYLLACDMEMDPVPGYRFASWAEGGRALHPRSTLRRAAWLGARHRDLRRSRRGGHPVPVAPDDPPEADRARDGQGLRAMGA